MMGAVLAASLASMARGNGRPWERRRYWLPEGFTVSTVDSLDAVDDAQSYHRRQVRNLAHEEGVRVLAETKRARRRARNLALRDLARLRSMQDAIARAEALAGGAS